MYEHTLDTPLNPYFVPEAGASLPLVAITESQEITSRTDPLVPIESSEVYWGMATLTESQVPGVQVHETSYETTPLQDTDVHEAATPFIPFIPVVHLTAPAPTCGLAGGLACSLPPDGSLKSIRLHLRMHGHRHPQRQIVQCPWTGCTDTLLWMNIPRHIQSIHLGIRFRCVNCGELYTRVEGLARHTASLKCNSQYPFCIEENALTTEWAIRHRARGTVKGREANQCNIVATT